MGQKKSVPARVTTIVDITGVDKVKLLKRLTLASPITLQPGWSIDYIGRGEDVEDYYGGRNVTWKDCQQMVLDIERSLEVKTEGEIDDDEATYSVSRGYIDYFYRKKIFADLSVLKVDATAYDQIVGPGTFQRIVDELKSKNEPPSWCLLDVMIGHLNVEPCHSIIMDFLLGDDCLDEKTATKVFLTKYVLGSSTYLDPEFMYKHSFDDEPAEKNEDFQVWYFCGQVHRSNDMPAKVHQEAIGRMSWYHRGLLHRDNDKPAIVRLVGKEWYRHGKRHRDGDKPALISRDGTVSWYVDDKLIRQAPAEFNNIELND